MGERKPWLRPLAHLFLRKGREAQLPTNRGKESKWSAEGQRPFDQSRESPRRMLRQQLGLGARLLLGTVRQGLPIGFLPK